MKLYVTKLHKSLRFCRHFIYKIEMEKVAIQFHLDNSLPDVIQIFLNVTEYIMIRRYNAQNQNSVCLNKIRNVKSWYRFRNRIINKQFYYHWYYNEDFTYTDRGNSITNGFKPSDQKEMKMMPGMPKNVHANGGGVTKNNVVAVWFLHFFQVQWYSRIIDIVTYFLFCFEL